MFEKEKSLYWLVLLLLAAFIVLGLIASGPGPALKGFLLIQQHPARLISDFTVVGGTGAALLNAGLTGLLALLLIRRTGVHLSGPTMAALFTVVGFSLFGKTLFNIAPVLAGVYLACRLIKKPFSTYLIIALFGTALGPLVTYLVYEAGFSGLPALAAGLLGGLTAGLLLPALAIAMLRLHEGYNLYNIGLTSGFFGLIAAAFLAASGKEMPIKVVWNNQPSLLLQLLVPVLSLLLLIIGLVLEGDWRKALKNLKAIQKLPGRLPSDFMEMLSAGSALINAGLMGLAFSLYIYLVKGDFNGPTIGGLFTVIGFSLFGKHLKNSWPVVLGVVSATLLFGKSLTAPGPLLAMLFGTTLAPLAGQFGPAVGFGAGFLHLMLVERTAAWHGGVDLYNNGFAGGLVATFIFAIISWIHSNRSNVNDFAKKRTP